MICRMNYLAGWRTILGKGPPINAMAKQDNTKRLTSSSRRYSRSSVEARAPLIAKSPSKLAAPVTGPCLLSKEGEPVTGARPGQLKKLQFV